MKAKLVSAINKVKATFKKKELYIGFLANITSDKLDPKDFKHFTYDRFITITEFFKQYDIKLLIYNPIDIDFKNKTVRGYFLEGQNFIPSTNKVPLINGDWTIDTKGKLEKHNISYEVFKSWLKDTGIKVYASYQAIDFLRNKYGCYQQFAKIKVIKQPYTEEYIHSKKQIEKFIKEYDKVFFKPQTGSKSKNIIMLKPDGRNFSLTYYPSDYYRTGKSKSKILHDINKTFRLIENYVGEKRYIIQQGITAIRYNDAPVNFRVIMVNDGKIWHPIHEVCIGDLRSDVSYTFENVTKVTHDFLHEYFSPRIADKLLDRLLKTALRLSEQIESLFPNSIPELAYDFLIDNEQNVYILEANAKPAMACPGINQVSKIFNTIPEEVVCYEEYIIPHAKFLAHFLKTRLDEL